MEEVESKMACQRGSN